MVARAEDDQKLLVFQEKVFADEEARSQGGAVTHHIEIKNVPDQAISAVRQAGQPHPIASGQRLLARSDASTGPAHSGNWLL
jgi:hypothetical protein